MKFLLLGDVHLADRPPGQCSDSYTDDLFDMLDYCARLSKEHDAVMIQAGDLFHLKHPSRNSHALVRRTIEALGKFQREVFIVPGNHDISHDRQESLISQPLGVVFTSGVATMLKGWDLEFGYPIYGVPWLQRFDDRMVSEALAGFREESGMPHNLVITHAPLYPPSQELSYEFYPSDKWAQAMGNQGSCYYGHVHEAHGVWKNAGVIFGNQGALSRGSIHEHNLKREISVTLWDSVNGAFTVVPIPHKPAEEVFKLSQVEVIREKQEQLNVFLESIGQASVEITSVESVLTMVKTMGLPEELLQTVQDLLEGVK